MAYATYEYYVETFKGHQIPVDQFDALAAKASSFVDLVTFDRAASEVDEAVIDKIAQATCAVAEEMYWQNAANLGSIASERVGQMSVTYVPMSDQQRSTRKREAAKTYLASTELMFGGLDYVD